MNAAQKWTILIALALIAVSASFAPYEFQTHNEIVRLAQGHVEPVRGIHYAPLWAPPSANNGVFGPDWSQKEGGTGAMVDEVQLAAGRLAITWAAILILAGAAILLMSGRRQES